MKRNTIKMVGVACSILLFITGCGKVPQLENGQDAVITIGDEMISVDTLYNKMKDKYALSVLLELMDTNILNQEYEDTDEITEEIESEVELLVKQYGSGSEATLLEQTYSAWGIDNMDDLKDYLKLQYKRNLAVEDYAKSIVTDDEINDFYEDKIFGDITVKHILISPDVDSDATDAEKTAAEEEGLKEANEIISKLNNGEDWDTLASEYSDDESNKDNGGLLAAFAYGDYEEDFEEAAKNLSDGKYTTTAVKTSYGYHIIYKVSQKDKPELKTVKDDIVEEIATDKLNDDATLQITALEELRKKYDVNIEDDTLKDQYETYIENAKKQASSN